MVHSTLGIIAISRGPTSFACAKVWIAEAGYG